MQVSWQWAKIVVATLLIHCGRVPPDVEVPEILLQLVERLPHRLFVPLVHPVDEVREVAAQQCETGAIAVDRVTNLPMFPNQVNIYMSSIRDLLIM